MKKPYQRGETIARVKKIAEGRVHKHRIESMFGGHGGHNGEYWYRCVDCDAQDWCASYGEPEDLFSSKPCVKKGGGQ